MDDGAQDVSPLDLLRPLKIDRESLELKLAYKWKPSRLFHTHSTSRDQHERSNQGKKILLSNLDPTCTCGKGPLIRFHFPKDRSDRFESTLIGHFSDGELLFKK